MYVSGHLGLVWVFVKAALGPRSRMVGVESHLNNAGVGWKGGKWDCGQVVHGESWENRRYGRKRGTGEGFFFVRR